MQKGKNNTSQETPTFPLHPMWEDPIRFLAQAFRLAIQSQSYTPRDLESLARLIHGLERLPAATQGIGIVVESTTTSRSNGNSGGISLELQEDCFEISSFETLVFDNISGMSDSSTRTILRVETNGNFECVLDDPVQAFYEIDEWASTWDSHLSDGGELEIQDETTYFNWDQGGPAGDWSQTSYEE